MYVYICILYIYTHNIYTYVYTSFHDDFERYHFMMISKGNTTEFYKCWVR